MRIIKTDDFSKKISNRSVITVGNFDGVHRGHREIFRRLCDQAAKDSAVSTVITFDPHPVKIIDPERAPAAITTLSQKLDLIAESDIDILLLIPFTRAFSNVSAADFVKNILYSSLGVSRLVVGHDYAFGKNREGDERFLKQFALELGFVLDVAEPVGDDTLIFSSSAVRRFVSDGDMHEAAKILGRCHRISGTVIHGREIGRTIGFPTANILSENELMPADGVYAVWVEVLGNMYMGACSIGLNPTFSAGERSLEVFLFDFNSELYGQQITVHFVEKIRNILRFEDAESLSKQIANDVTRVRTILSSSLPSRQDK